MSDLFDFTHQTVSGARLEMVAMPDAWQVTADNMVTRHYAPRTAASAVNAGEQINVVDQKLRTLQNLLGTSKKEVDGLEARIRDLAHDFRAPESELATAQQALIDLQRRNDSLIKQCRMWKQRTEDAKRISEQFEAALQEERKKPQAPAPEPFIRQRTPGDSVRYLAAEVMKYAQDNIELAGIAIALRMVADNVDRLPQG